MNEAAFIAFKELIKLAGVIGLLVHLFGPKTTPMRMFFVSSLLTGFAALGTLLLPPDHRLSYLLVKWNETVVAGMLIGVVAFVFLRDLGGEEDLTPRPPSVPAGVALLLLPPVYFLPDWGGSAAFLRQVAGLRGDPTAVLSGLVAGGIAAGIVVAVARRLIRRVPRSWRWFGLPQALLFLTGLKMATGGVGGYAEYSLIPSLQRMFMKLAHDLVHHTFTIVLVPDHPLLKISAWNFIGFFFGSNFGLMVTIAFLLLPPAAFLTALLRAPVRYPDTCETPADRRLHRARVQFDRLRRSTAVWVFCALVLGAWFMRGSGEISRVYDPEPRPVVADKGIIVIPRKDPTMDLADGRIHKFSFLDRGRTVRILVLSRPDESLAVCLDACEICPPDGYGQEGSHVMCLYCNTPIPAVTLGTPGGCNPIPLESVITEGEIRIQVADLVARWDEVDSGKTRREAVP